MAALVPRGGGAASPTAPQADDEYQAASNQTSEPLSPRTALAAELRDSADRVTSARVKAEFEHSLLSCLLFNVLYMYYIDHRLIVLLIRFSQMFRLLYFPHEPREMQRVTALLLVMSNIAIALIHGAILIEGTPGDMLLINFVGPEPHALSKLFYVDLIIVILQLALMSIGGHGVGIVTCEPIAVISPVNNVAFESSINDDSQIAAHLDDTVAGDPGERNNGPSGDSRETLAEESEPEETEARALLNGPGAEAPAPHESG